MIRDINSPTRYATTNVTVETFRLPNPTIAIVEYETTNSMIGAHIAPGDLVLVRPQEAAENGDIVVALIDGEATVKRYRRDAGSVTLFPENSAMEPIVFVGEAASFLTIIGKVVGIVFLIDLTFLHGIEKLKGYKVKSIIQF